MAAPSADSITEAEIYRIPLQFQSQRHKGKAPVGSQGPTLMNTEFQGPQAQLQQRQQEQEAALVQVQKLQNQQAVNTWQLQHTAADTQNTANTSAAYQAQLSSSVSSHLDNISKILNTNFPCIDGDLKKSFYNQKFIYNTMKSRHQKSE